MTFDEHVISNNFKFGVIYQKLGQVGVRQVRGAGRKCGEGGLLLREAVAERPPWPLAGQRWCWGGVRGPRLKSLLGCTEEPPWFLLAASCCDRQGTPIKGRKEGGKLRLQTAHPSCPPPVPPAGGLQLWRLNIPHTHTHTLLSTWAIILSPPSPQTMQATLPPSFEELLNWLLGGGSSLHLSSAGLSSLGNQTGPLNHICRSFTVA